MRLTTIPTGWYVSGIRGRHGNRSATNTSARPKILLAALSVIRAKGYAGTSVDDLCVAAGVTKGAFFHHFKKQGRPRRGRR